MPSEAPGCDPRCPGRFPRSPDRLRESRATVAWLGRWRPPERRPPTGQKLRGLGEPGVENRPGFLQRDLAAGFEEERQRPGRAHQAIGDVQRVDEIRIEDLDMADDRAPRLPALQGEAV